LKKLERLKGGHPKNWVDAVRAGREAESNFENGGALCEIGVIAIHPLADLMNPTALFVSSGNACHSPHMILRSIPCAFLALPLVLSAAEPPPGGKPEAAQKPSPELQAAREKLVLPGVKINVAQWCVDVDARVCLVEGMLELIACTKDTKEHESIVAVEAKPSHIHTALLLLRAKPGSPARQKALDPEGTRFMPVPPIGSPVDVFLVIKDANGKDTELPINDFMISTDPSEEPEAGAKPVKFPTQTFLFAGSGLEGNGEGPRDYACDLSGNVISLATFGDELLCLPGIHDPSDSLRMWQVDGGKLPALDSRIILRLRPRVDPPGDAPTGR
jgi:hypothetical protein